MGRNGNKQNLLLNYCCIFLLIAKLFDLFSLWSAWYAFRDNTELWVAVFAFGFRAIKIAENFLVLNVINLLIGITLYCMLSFIWWTWRRKSDQVTQYCQVQGHYLDLLSLYLALPLINMRCGSAISSDIPSHIANNLKRSGSLVYKYISLVSGKVGDSCNATNAIWFSGCNIKRLVFYTIQVIVKGLSSRHPLNPTRKGRFIATAPNYTLNLIISR